MSHTRPVRLAALVAALTAAPLILSASPASSVAGTPVTDTSLAYTAQVMVGDNVHGCSGVLVDPQWLATAASCFTDDPAAGTVIPAGPPAQKTTATIGRTDLTAAGGQVREITELVPRTDRDLVMARLATPVTTVAPVPLATTPATTPATTGDTLTAAGYGRTKDAWVPDKLHTATFQATTTNGTDITLTPSTTTDAICAGDAGGPLLRRTSTGYELVGINSRSWQGGCYGSVETRNGAVSPRTDNTVLASALAAGGTLATGDMLVSATARLAMLPDGNLTIASNAGKTLWSTGTAGHPGAKATFTTTGNLTVTAPDGTTLWQSRTTATGGQLRLQDRGNLTVTTTDGTSQWSSGTATRHDYDGDGRSDMAAWYDYADGHDALHTFKSAADGTVQQPFQSYASQVGSWYAEHMQFSTGDYNGDGRGDMAALYGYSDGSVSLFTALGKPDGGFQAPSSSWSATPGSWTATNMTLHSGDFNGDGRDDLAAWYDYDNGDDKLFTFLSKTDGGFEHPFSSWSNTNNDWNREQLQFVSGDWNADGRDDLGALCGYADGTVRMFSWLGTGAGGFQGSIASWSSSTFGSWSRTHIYAGDFNGDGHDDVAAWYDYSDGHDAIHVLTGSSTEAGHFNTPFQAYETAIGNFNYADMRIVPGDYNGDGRDDLAAMYSYSDGYVRMFTWTARTDGMINGSVAGWASATTTGWGINNSIFLRTAN